MHTFLLGSKGYLHYIKIDHNVCIYNRWIEYIPLHFIKITQVVKHIEKTKGQKV